MRNPPTGPNGFGTSPGRGARRFERGSRAGRGSGAGHGTGPGPPKRPGPGKGRGTGRPVGRRVDRLLDGQRARHVRVHVTPEEVRARREGRHLVHALALGEDLTLEDPLGGGAVGEDRHVVGGAVLVLERHRERLAGGRLHVLRLELDPLGHDDRGVGIHGRGRRRRARRVRVGGGARGGRERDGCEREGGDEALHGWLTSREVDRRHRRSSGAGEGWWSTVQAAAARCVRRLLTQARPAASSRRTTVTGLPSARRKSMTSRVISATSMPLATYAVL